MNVSPRARNGFDYYVAQAAKNSLAANAAECAVCPADEPVAPEQELVMLTVTTYGFRVVVFIHFNRDLSTRAHFASLAGQPVEAMDEVLFNDTMMERGNLFCGAFNRDLTPFFPHTGMSTPCVLARTSMEHVDHLHPAYTACYRAELAPGVVLHVTLAVCAFGDVDFEFEPRAADEVDTAGELEMF